MPSLNSVFDDDPELAGLSTSERMDVLSAVHDRVKESGRLNNGQLRQLRDAQMETLYDEDVKAGAVPQGQNFAQWKRNMRGLGTDEMTDYSAIYGAMAPQAGKKAESPNQELFNQLYKRNFMEDLSAAGDAATNWKAYPVGLGNALSEVFQLITGVANTVLQDRLAALTPWREKKTSPLEDFSQGMETAANTAPAKYVKQWYDDVIKDDPDLYKMYHAALTDATIGAVIGGFRVVKAGADLASGMQKARTLLAPVVSNVTSGQLIYQGLEGLDEQLKDTNLTDAQKNTARMTVLLAAALGGGMTVEPFIERMIAGDAKALRAAQRIGENIQSGKSFTQEILDSPDITDEIKEVVNEVTGAQNLDSAYIAEKMDDIVSAEAKVKAGEELTAEEAQALQGAKPKPGVEPLAPDEVVSFTPQQPIGAAPFDDLSLPYWRGDSVLDRVRQHRDVRLQEQEAMHGVLPRKRQFWERRDTEAPQQEASPQEHFIEPEGEKGPDVIPPAEAAQGARGLVPYGKFATTQRGLVTIDELTARARAMAKEGATPEQLAPLKQHLQDVQATIAIANDGLENVIKQTKKELQEAQQYVKNGRQLINDPASFDPDKLADMEQKIAEAEQRVGTLQDRLIVLQRKVKQPETSIHTVSRTSEEQRILEAQRQYDSRVRDLLATVRKAREMKESGQQIPESLRNQWRAQNAEVKPAAQELAEARVAKAAKEAESALSKAADKATRSDVMTKIDELTPTQQARVKRVAEAVIQGKEYLLARSLTEEERLDELTKVFNSQSWVDRTYAPSNTKVLTDGYLSAGWVEDNYPTFAKLNAFLDPESVSTGVVRPDVVLRAMQDIEARAGFGMSPEGYAQSRELMRETFEVWDEVKASIPSGKGANLKEFLQVNNKMFGLNKRQAANVADRISDAFPELDIAFQYSAGLKGDATSLADSLTKLVTIGADQKGLDQLSHEIGHLHFNYGLDSESKLAWLDNMRKAATDEAHWTQAFPGYSERLAGLAQMDELSAAKQLFWAHHPTEMYAQQFSSFLLNSVIPNAETLSTLGRLQQGIKRLLGVSYSDFEKLSPDTQQFFLRTLAQPDVETARRALPSDIDEALGKSWVSSGDRETDLRHIQELQRELDETYNGVSLGSVVGEADDALTDAALSKMGNSLTQGRPNFWELPVADRVMAYRFEDLNKALRVQALSIYHNLPGANAEEARLLSQRLGEMLSEKNIPELVENLAGRGRVRSKWGQETDPLSGIRYESASERRAVEYQQMMDARTTEFNRLDTAVQHTIERANTEKWKAKFRDATDAFESLLRAEGQQLSKQEIRAAVQRALFGEPPANSLEAEFQKSFGSSMEAEPFDLARSNAEKLVASNSREYSDLSQFCSLAMAKNGLIELTDPAFSYRMSRAEAFAAMPGQAQSTWPVSATKGAVRALVGITAGLEYDPDGVYVPWLGHATWSPERYFSNPLAVLITPGVASGAKFLASKSGKLANLGYQRLPLSLRKKVEEQVSQVKRTFKAFATEGMGMPEDLKDAKSRARVFARVKQQEFLEFAEIMQRHYTPKERANIARILEQDAGWRGLTKWALAYRPDILSTVDILKKVTSQIEKDFTAMGIQSPNFADLQGKYLTRFYANLGKKNLRSIFETSNIRPIRLDLLKRRGLAITVKNSNNAGVPDRVYTELKQHFADLGEDPAPGMQINSYKTAGGATRYAKAGTALDQSYTAQLTPDHVWGKNSQGYLIEDSTNASIKLRRDYTSGERRLMGEVKDVSVRLAYMGEQLRRSYERASLFNNIAGSKWILNPRDPNVVEVPGLAGIHAKADAIDYAKNSTDWVEVPDSIDKSTGIAKYGPLAGTYMHKDVFDALQALDKAESVGIFTKGAKDSPWSTGYGAYRRLLTHWKLNKTVRSPTAHVNNFVSNIMMGYLLGHNPVAEIRHGLAIRSLRNMDIKAGQLWKEGKQQESNALKQKVQASPYYDTYMRIRKSGMADSSMWASELKSQELADQLLQGIQDPNKPKSVIGAIWNSIKGIDRMGARAYEDGDLIFKMGSFHRSISEGLSESEALRRAYEAYFDYSNLAPAAQMLRDSGLVPFISYSYKAVPALKKAVMEHPERLALMTLAFQGLHDVGVASMYGADEVIKNREALDESRPQYLRKKALGGLLNTRIAIPGLSGMTTDENGQERMQASYLDVSRMIPGGDMFEVGSGGVGDLEFSMLGAGELVGNMVLQSPVLASAMNAVAGKNLALGSTYNSGGDLDDPEVKSRTAGAFLRDLFTSYAPNIAAIPYTYSNQAIMEGLVGAGVLEEGTWGTYGTSGKDSVGVPRAFSTAVASQFGVKIRPVLPEETLAREISHQETMYRDEAGRLSSMARNQRWSQKRIEEEIATHERVTDRYVEKQERRLSILDRLREARQKVQGGQTLLH